jgi:hypothetical protein
MGQFQNAAALAGRTISDAGLVLTRDSSSQVSYSFPGRAVSVEVDHHWRMVAACCYALLVEVLDLSHGGMITGDCHHRTRRFSLAPASAA